jgi:retron-type reverse transcriptase
MPEDKPGEVTLETVLAVENLRSAWLAVKANDGAPGVDKMDMERSARHLREHGEKIRAKLLAGEYKPGADDLRTLTRENAQLRMENDIVKKAAIIPGTGNPHNSAK